ERMAEGIVGGEEEPAVAAALGDGLRGADGERVRVEGPLNAVRRAEFAGEVVGARRMNDKQLLLLPRHLLDGEAHRGNRNIEDQVDVLGIVPLPRDLRADISALS